MYSHQPESDDPFVTLDIRELRAMAALDPAKLLRWLSDSESDFILGIEKQDFTEDSWGGQYRVTLNRNIEIHFVPNFNTAMLDGTELPQFTVMPDALKIGMSEEREIKLPVDEHEADDQEPEREYGVTFFVAPEDYKILTDECEEILDKWAADGDAEVSTLSFPFLPESYFRDFDLHLFCREKVLAHKRVQDLRRFDGRLGYPIAQPELTDDDFPEPVITDEDDEYEEAMLGDMVLDDADLEELEERAIEEARRREGY